MDEREPAPARSNTMQRITCLGNTDKDADPAIQLVGQASPGITSILTGRPRLHQKEPPCGSMARASRGEMRKNSGVEIGEAVEETAPSGIAQPGPPPAPDRPRRIPPGTSAFGRYFADALASGCQIDPELIHIGRPRITTAQADNRDRLRHLVGPG